MYTTKDFKRKQGISPHVLRAEESLSNTKEDGSSSKSVIAALCGNILVLIVKIIALS